MLAFSTDGSQWQQYTENGAVKVIYRSSREAVSCSLVYVTLKRIFKDGASICYGAYLLCISG